MAGQEVTATAPRGDGSGEGERYRTTIYLGERELTALDELRTHLRRQERRRIDRSHIIREAIRRYYRDVLEG